ncbi:Ig-like domain-containing protein [Streptosporangium sp. NPDC023825]|uniref:Ig-like domain-containing protein n=1 Tax=Streptosporangium sp. NPDC023825 TaxID=3154909 RepID=UPI00343E3C23
MARSGLAGILAALIAMGVAAVPGTAAAATAATAAHNDAGPSPDPGTAVSPASAVCGTVTTSGLVSTCGEGNDSGPITFTATVTAADGSVPTGRVTFATDGVTLGRALLVDGVATLTMSSLPTGVYRVVAYYPGTAQFDPSNTPLLIQRVGLDCPCTPGSQVGQIRVRVNGETRSPAPGERVRTRIVFGRSA